MYNYKRNLNQKLKDKEGYKAMQLGKEPLITDWMVNKLKTNTGFGYYSVSTNLNHPILITGQYIHKINNNKIDWYLMLVDTKFKIIKNDKKTYNIEFVVQNIVSDKTFRRNIMDGFMFNSPNQWMKGVLKRINVVKLFYPDHMDQYFYG